MADSPTSPSTAAPEPPAAPIPSPNDPNSLATRSQDQPADAQALAAAVKLTAAAINATAHRAQTNRNVQGVNVHGETPLYVRTVDLCAYSSDARRRLCSASTQEAITTTTGCSITTRGRYIDTRDAAAATAVERLHLYLEAATQNAVDSAVALIKLEVNSAKRDDIVDQSTRILLLPDRLVDGIIGPAGETLNEIMQATQAHVQVTNTLVAGTQDRRFRITGSVEAVDNASRAITRLSEILIKHLAEEKRAQHAGQTASSAMPGLAAPESRGREVRFSVAGGHMLGAGNVGLPTGSVRVPWQLAPAAGILPPGWSEAFDAVTQQPFYRHTTGVTSWQRPQQ